MWDLREVLEVRSMLHDCWLTPELGPEFGPKTNFYSRPDWQICMTCNRKQMSNFCPWHAIGQLIPLSDGQCVTGLKTRSPTRPSQCSLCGAPMSYECAWWEQSCPGDSLCCHCWPELMAVTTRVCVRQVRCDRSVSMHCRSSTKTWEKERATDIIWPRCVMKCRECARAQDPQLSRFTHTLRCCMLLF